MKVVLNEVTRIFTDSESEANEIVEDAQSKFGDRLKTHTVARRQKRGVEFFVVTLTIEHQKIAELLITEE